MVSCRPGTVVVASDPPGRHRPRSPRYRRDWTSMPPSAGSPEFDLEVAALKERYAGLRQAAAMPGADAGAVLEAAFAELDAAVEVLGAMRAGPVPAAA